VNYSHRSQEEHEFAVCQNRWQPFSIAGNCANVTVSRPAIVNSEVNPKAFAWS